MTADSVRDVNNMSDKDGILYVRNPMILCLPAENVNGRWESGQLQA